MNKYAEALLQLGAVKLSPQNPFLYASGLRGPMYCDNRALLSHPKERNLIIDGLIEQQNSLSYQQLAGLATAGIPHAAMMADRLSKPMCYVRSKAKEHGRGNQVEGDITQGEKVLMVEDLVNQGSSLKDAVAGVRKADLLVDDCLCIVDYQMPKAKLVCQELGIKLHALVTFEELIHSALAMKVITDADILTLKNWHNDPENWSKQWS